MKRTLFAMVLVLSLVLLLVSCQGSYAPGHQEDPPLSALHTPYIGDHMAVSRILAQLPMPEGWAQRFTAMGNASDFGSPELAPYTLTVFYHLAYDTVVVPTEDALSIAVFEHNAGWLFALIDSLMEVTFAMRTTPLDGNELLQETYTLYWSITREDAVLPEINDTTE